MLKEQVFLRSLAAVDISQLIIFRLDYRHIRARCQDASTPRNVTGYVFCYQLNIITVLP